MVRDILHEIWESEWSLSCLVMLWSLFSAEYQALWQTELTVTGLLACLVGTGDTIHQFFRSTLLVSESYDQPSLPILLVCLAHHEGTEAAACTGQLHRLLQHNNVWSLGGKNLIFYVTCSSFASHSEPWQICVQVGISGCVTLWRRTGNVPNINSR